MTWRSAVRDNRMTEKYDRIAIHLQRFQRESRLDAAERLLRCEELEVYLVAMAVGYDHQETFYRAYQRRFARTPSRGRNGIGLD